MKKKIGSTLGNIFKRVINIPAWFDFDRVKSGSDYILNGFKKLFIPQSSVVNEDFSNVVKKLKLTNDDIKKKQISLWRLSVLMVITAGLIFLYGCFCFIVGHYIAGALSLVVTLIALVLGFRYHFWSFQIKKRKLGCTFKEWYQEGLRGRCS